MHMKSCGNVYVCKCGIRLCSLGALKRHCKYFSHDPESLDPRPDPSNPGGGADGSSLEWHEEFEGGAHPVQGGESEMPQALTLLQPMGDGKGGYYYPSATALRAAMGQSGCYAPMGGAAPPGMSGHLEAPLNAGMNHMQPSGRPSAEFLQHLQAGQAAGAPGCAAAACGQEQPSNGCAISPAMGMQPMNAQALGPQWTPEMLNGLLPSLAQALRQAQSGIPVDFQAIGRAAWAPAASGMTMHHQLGSTIGATPEALNGAMHRAQGDPNMFPGVDGSPKFEQLRAAARVSRAGGTRGTKKRKLPDHE